MIDGSMGEGGGQILRTALALSLVTGEPFRVERIRAGREKPGLLRQHLTAVQAAARIGAAEVSGDELGSMALSFAPRGIWGGDQHFAIGSAGSTTLVLQTILPALLRAEAPSRISIEGGTHNKLAPPYEHLARSFLPLLCRMGAAVELRLERPGFYPAGGGLLVATVTPSSLAPIELLERGPIVRRCATALMSGLPGDIGKRELAVVRERLGWHEGECHLRTVKHPAGPGNVLTLEVESSVTEVVTSFAERRLPAEVVAARAVDELSEYLAAGVPVGPHLADQLLLPFALAGGGALRTMPLTMHTRTQLELIPKFLPMSVSALEEKGGNVKIEVCRA